MWKSQLRFERCYRYSVKMSKSNEKDAMFCSNPKN